MDGRPGAKQRRAAASNHGTGGGGGWGDGVAPRKKKRRGVAEDDQDVVDTFHHLSHPDSGPGLLYRDDDDAGCLTTVSPVWSLVGAGLRRKHQCF